MIWQTEWCYEFSKVGTFFWLTRYSQDIFCSRLWMTVSHQNFVVAVALLFLWLLCLDLPCNKLYVFICFKTSKVKITQKFDKSLHQICHLLASIVLLHKYPLSAKTVADIRNLQKWWLISAFPHPKWPHFRYPQNPSDPPSARRLASIHNRKMKSSYDGFESDK